jgi:ring-1,2-phenylacetyl-CoA epoxidase subunit PaaD
MVIAAATATDPRVTAIRHALEAVKDPEIPVLTIANLGIVRDVRFDADGLEIVITPTYSGCPAMHMIEAEILETCKWQGYADARVTTVLSPAWTTDWIDEEGREKLRRYGIAPPQQASTSKLALFGEAPQVACPRCGSHDTERVSEFGSTACKALHKCRACLEPFDYFKCI